MKELNNSHLFKEILYFHLDTISVYDFEKSNVFNIHLSTKQFNCRLQVNNFNDYQYSLRVYFGTKLFQHLHFIVSYNNKIELHYVFCNDKIKVENDQQPLNRTTYDIYLLFHQLNENNIFKLRDKINDF